MSVRPAQGAGADDAEAMDCRRRVDEYENTSRRPVERPGDKTPATDRRGIVCAKLSAGIILIRESPMSPAQHILFFVIYT